MTSESPGHRVVVIGPDGQPVGYADVPLGRDGNRDDNGDGTGDGASASPADAIGEPAKVMRIGTMIKQLLEEVRAAPLDDASRARLRAIHERSIKELETGLTPELRDELERTRQAWETTDLDGFLASGQLPVLSQNAHSHQVVADELLRRPSSG